MSSDRVKFDIACALSVVSESLELPNIFPERLSLEGKLQSILLKCIDFETLEESSCKLRQDAPQSDAYALSVGKDKLRLAPRGSIILGGSGVTVQLHDPTIKRFFALKVPRVSVLAYKHSTNFEEFDRANFVARFRSEVKAFENERLIFRRLSHEHVAQHLFGSDKSVPYEKGDGFDSHARLPFSVSEWIDGAQPLHKYLQSYLTEDKQKELSLDRVISLMTQSFEALAHLQERKVLHWDIKCDNLLVSENHTIKLIDFGNAKKLDLLDGELDLIATTTEAK